MLRGATTGAVDRHENVSLDDPLERVAERRANADVGYPVPSLVAEHDRRHVHTITWNAAVLDQKIGSRNAELAATTGAAHNRPLKRVRAPDELGSFVHLSGLEQAAYSR